MSISNNNSNYNETYIPYISIRGHPMFSNRELLLCNEKINPIYYYKDDLYIIIAGLCIGMTYILVSYIFTI